MSEDPRINTPEPENEQSRNGSGRSGSDDDGLVSLALMPAGLEAVPETGKELNQAERERLFSPRREQSRLRKKWWNTLYNWTDGMLHGVG